MEDSSTCTVVEPNLPFPLHKLYNASNATLTDVDLKQQCAKVFEEIKVTKEEADFLQKATINQSQCLTWHEYRKGRITAFHFYDVCRHVLSSRIYPTSIVKRIMQYYSSTKNVAAMKWGGEKEDGGRKDYVAFTEAKHNCMFVVHQCGLVIDPKYPFLGASPDGIVCCACCGKGVLEIKCPFKYRDYSPTDDLVLSDYKYCLKRSPNGNIHLSSKHKYYYQVQGQIALCSATYCDFVCWTEKGLFIK